MRLAAEMDGDSSTAADSGAEVVWRDTEARTFAAIVDGVVKLSSEGAPLEDLLDLVPGMTQQKIQGIGKKMRGARVASLVDRLTAQPDGNPSSDDGVEPTDAPQESSATEEANVLKSKFDALGVAIRAGVEPADAANRLGLAGIRFTGGVPVSLRMPNEDVNGTGDSPVPQPADESVA